MANQPVKVNLYYLALKRITSAKIKFNHSHNDPIFRGCAKRWQDEI